MRDGNILVHSLKLGTLIVYMMNIVYQSKEHVNKTRIHVYIQSQIGKFAYEIELCIQMDKEDFMHDTN